MPGGSYGPPQVLSASIKPRLAGRQPSTATGCPGWRPGGRTRRSQTAVRDRGANTRGTGRHRAARLRRPGGSTDRGPAAYGQRALSL